ncbi:hypothetical protein [Collimonas fungivorans]|uniref:hypothetical protein n=1 Tax=Collimonas fungivorans TaxID=158899 RepID=UPI00059F6B5E|nr:hypothetical protein [Collimonas fungivorans]
MGKQPPKTDQNGKMKVRIIEFELEGSDISLQESLKSITAALSRPSIVTPVRIQRIDANRQTDVAQNGEAESVSEADDSDFVDGQVNEISPAPVKTAKRTMKLPTPSLLRDVRFDDVQPTFSDFILEKDPKSEMLKYLCVAFWLKSYKDIQEISIDHIYTAYRVMSWALPANAVQPMRELAATRDGRFSKGVEKGHYVINHVGEGFVNTKMARV